MRERHGQAGTAGRCHAAIMPFSVALLANSASRATEMGLRGYATGTGSGAGGPTYRELGRMSWLPAACSMTWAHQPMTRLHANVGVNSSRGRPHASITTPA